MNWVKNHVDQWINLETLYHIWIDKSVNGFFLNGELIHSGEEVILSKPFESFDECLKFGEELLK